VAGRGRWSRSTSPTSIGTASSAWRRPEPGGVDRVRFRAREVHATTVEDEVRAFNATFERALAEQDLEALVGLYTDDARMMVVGRPAIQGRPAIEAALRAWIGDGPVSIRFETDEVMADATLVVEIGHMVGTDGRTKYVVVHRRQPDGSLRIAVDAPSSDGPAPV
jgi:uncharacterized protein (TIGR02246 family)